MVQDFTLRPIDEHSFWLEVLQDHAYFIRDHLAPTEQQYIAVADQYIQSFEYLRENLKNVGQMGGVADQKLIQFAQDVHPTAEGYYQFEGHMQNLRIQNLVNLNLSPTYLNGTLSENEEYLRILSYYMNGQDFPPQSLVDLLDLWLEDQLGHAVLLRNILDPIELKITAQTDRYIEQFQSYIVQNEQMKGFLRFSPPGIQRQQRFSREVGQTTIDMYNFIVGVVQMYRGTEVITRTTLRFLEHHFPESCYFIRKLSYYSPELGPKAAQCPLTKPSFD
ncbi:DUF2935 domain-containing protein [Alkalihalobacillus sp. MEB130]|uniref:DUF2935 domain-containing protein n=1 Tax=Alkalihalobacillus sp. MEB130 TaxID=2976704 RepID=UPI0028E08778|nr:DUF2935 domain-containing protein [Alkalihalobacillus sp. MEB130]MDT8861385.1 DUF2935 domain-containing protein [Alkalihalobacillus sp. MEB130]